MKKNLLLILAIFCMATSVMGTTYMISCGGMSFTPSTVTVHPGDVIMWVWANGMHTTTSTTIPTGATAWSNGINSTSTSFSYTPTVPGTYNFQCNYHVSMGMVGTITVVSGSGIEPINTTPIFGIYPNPVSGFLHLVFSNPITSVSVTLTNIIGIDVMSKVFSGTPAADLNIGDLPNGNYILLAQRGDQIYKQVIVVSH